MKQIQAGTYNGWLSGNGQLGNSSKGSLMFNVMVNIDGVAPEPYGFCLVNASGEIRQRSVDDLFTILDGRWTDKSNIEQLECVDCEGIQVSLVIGDDEYNGKVYSKIQFCNPVHGGGRAMPEKLDGRTAASKFGAQFRALYGGGKPAPTKPAGAAPAKPSAPPPSKAPPPSAAPSSGPTSTMNACWDAYYAKNNAAGMADNDITAAWLTDLKAAFPKTTQDKLTPAQWGKFMADKCVTDGAEGMPF